MFGQSFDVPDIDVLFTTDTSGIFQSDIRLMRKTVLIYFG